MAIPTTNKRSIMTLYSGLDDVYSHRVRIVLAEKAVTYDLHQIDGQKPVEELIEVNPYNTVPTLVDRDLVLYESQVIMEYLDERFPHPPLMPVYPVARARSRLMMHRVNHDWYHVFNKILDKKSTAAQLADNKKALLESLISVAPLFVDMPYFLSEEFSLVDCLMGPLLWRLPSLQIKIPPQAKSLQDYANRLFARDAFQVSLTSTERALGG